MQPVSPTGTKGERSIQNGIRVPPPLVGRPSASEELGSTPQKRDHYSTTMVRVPGSSGDSGFHCESLDEDVKIKTEPGIKAAEAKGSPQTRETKGSLNYKSFRRALRIGKIKRNIHRSIWTINPDSLLRYFRVP